MFIPKYKVSISNIYPQGHKIKNKNDIEIGNELYQGIMCLNTFR